MRPMTTSTISLPPHDAALTGELGTFEGIQRPERRLYSEGACWATVGGPCAIPPGSPLTRLPGTWFLDPASGSLAAAAVPTQAEVDQARHLLATSTLPGRGTRWEDMAAAALLDIVVCQVDNGAVIGAPSHFWRYVWIRDTAFIATGLALCGQVDRAWASLAYVADRIEPDGTWEARYLPDGSHRVPDDRGRQLDGNGWYGWGVATVAMITGTTPPPSVSTALEQSLRAAIQIVAADGLPRPSQDYWETDIDEPVLGVAAPLRAGLVGGASLVDDELARQCRDTARRLDQGITEQFGSAGYPRRLGGGGLDAAVAYLLPPFGPARPDVIAAWRRALDLLSVSNGGWRPGEEWPDPETAWTPQTSLFALTAAQLSTLDDTTTADRDLAADILDWLDARRTAWGSLPEKVNVDGQPAAVAPIPLVAATVLAALAALDGRPLPTMTLDQTSPTHHKE